MLNITILIPCGICDASKQHTELVHARIAARLTGLLKQHFPASAGRVEVRVAKHTNVNDAVAVLITAVTDVDGSELVAFVERHVDEVLASAFNREILTVVMMCDEAAAAASARFA